MSLLIECDENGSPTDMRSISETKRYNDLHNAVSLLLFNKQGELLVCTRQDGKIFGEVKKSFSVSGKVTGKTNYGKGFKYYDGVGYVEEWETAIRRETRQELGHWIAKDIVLSEAFSYIHRDKQESSFRKVYFGISDKRIEYDEIEIKEIKYYSLSDLVNEMNETPLMFTPPFLKGIEFFIEQSAIYKETSKLL